MKKCKRLTIKRKNNMAVLFFENYKKKSRLWNFRKLFPEISMPCFYPLLFFSKDKIGLLFYSIIVRKSFAFLFVAEEKK